MLVLTASPAQAVQLRYYWAVWCGPCKVATPTVMRVAAKYRLPILSFDWDAMSVAERKAQAVEGVPIIILTDDAGRVLARYGDNARQQGEFAFDPVDQWLSQTMQKSIAPSSIAPGQ